MRLPDALLQSVAFLCAEKDDGELIYFGTAFFLGVRDPDSTVGAGWGYIVTARHCIENVERAGYPRWGIRLSLASGGTRLYSLPYSAWLFSEQDGVDVAVCRMAPPGDSAHNVVGGGLLISEAIIQEMSVGIGDELVVPGLFTYFVGSEQNTPIIRTGILAATPSDPFVDDNSGLPFRGYLAELRSFGGLSGSPAFVRWDAQPFYGRSGPALYLLGMIRAHWDSFRDRLSVEPDESRALNLGIVTVTPLADILAVVDNEDERRWQRSQAQGEDSGSG